MGLLHDFVCFFLGVQFKRIHSSLTVSLFSHLLWRLSFRGVSQAHTQALHIYNIRYTTHRVHFEDKILCASIIMFYTLSNYFLQFMSSLTLSHCPCFSSWNVYYLVNLLVNIAFRLSIIKQNVTMYDKYAC